MRSAGAARRLAAGRAGLVQAVRSGNVVVANALGSGLLEAPALLAFLPQLCRHLLGEDLRLPSVPTWWCGRPADRDYVLQNISSNWSSSRRSSAPHASRSSARRLCRGESTELIERIETVRANFVGQEL